MRILRLMWVTLLGHSDLTIMFLSVMFRFLLSSNCNSAISNFLGWSILWCECLEVVLLEEKINKFKRISTSGYSLIVYRSPVFIGQELADWRHFCVLYFSKGWLEDEVDLNLETSSRLKVAWVAFALESFKPSHDMASLTVKLQEYWSLTVEDAYLPVCRVFRNAVELDSAPWLKRHDITWVSRAHLSSRTCPLVGDS